MTEPAAFYVSVQRTGTVPSRGVFQLVLEGPIEKYLEALQAIGSLTESKWIAIARLDVEQIERNRKEAMPNIPATRDDTRNTQQRKEVMSGQPVDEAQTTKPNKTAPGLDTPARPHKPVAPEKRLAQRAGMLCADKEFGKFLEYDLGLPILSEDDAATALRGYCNVTSRSEIKPNTEAGRIFDHLYSRFVAWRDADIYVEAS